MENDPKSEPNPSPSLDAELARLKESAPATHDFLQSVKSFMEKFAQHS